MIEISWTAIGVVFTIIIVIAKDIPMTSDELLVSTTLILGQPDDINRCVFVMGLGYKTNMTNSKTLWIASGRMRVVVQPLVINSQLTI